jgi:hypothetical protein
MQPFKRNHLQHALAVSAWMREHNAVGGQDPLNLVMEIAQGDKTVRLFPQFDAESDIGTVFVNQLSPGVIGFVGWYPYPPKGWPIAQNKLAFKEFARRSGLRTPAWSRNVDEVKGPVLVKREVSSLGAGQRGPFMMAKPPGPRADICLAADEFCEQFITGQLLKAWYWCDELAVVEVVNMPTVQGNGQSTVRQLFQSLTKRTDLALPEALLRIQGVVADDVLRQGRSLIVDYQYLAQSNPSLYADYNCRGPIRGTPFEAQLKQAGRLCWAEVPEATRGIGAAMTIDGVVDADGRAWFLEVNCNPRLHPAFYAPMLDAIFLEPKLKSPQ